MDIQNMKDFSTNLIYLRALSGLTQKELGQRIKVSGTSIGFWELKKSQPTAENIISLANYFSLTTDELLGIQEISIESKKTSSLENEILESVQQLDPDLQNQVLGYSRALQSQYEKLKRKS